MSKLIEQLKQLKEQDPDTFDLIQQLAKNARNPAEDPHVRLRCAMVLGNTLGPLLLESVREEFLKSTEPRYEYRFIRGAKVKVRVN